MSLRDILRNPEIFREPLAFLPERWLPTNPDYEKYNYFYVPFSRGTRNCIGINMAYAQLYIVLATLFRRLDLRIGEDVLYERDVEGTRDCFIRKPSFDSKGVRV